MNIEKQLKEIEARIDNKLKAESTYYSPLAENTDLRCELSFLQGIIIGLIKQIQYEKEVTNEEVNSNGISVGQ
jgi:hypothetical protein